MSGKREDNELPQCLTKWGWKYHHMGILPNEKKSGEKYLPHLKFHVSGFNTCPFGIEWMRFDDDSHVDKLIQKLPHVAFEVDDLDNAVSEHDFEIIAEPCTPSEGVRTAMIKNNGVSVELIEFNKNL